VDQYFCATPAAVIAAQHIKTAVVITHSLAAPLSHHQVGNLTAPYTVHACYAPRNELHTLFNVT
jgi:hypothetical protein